MINASEEKLMEEEEEEEGGGGGCEPFVIVSWPVLMFLLASLCGILVTIDAGSTMADMIDHRRMSGLLCVCVCVCVCVLRFLTAQTSAVT